MLPNIRNVGQHGGAAKERIVRTLWKSNGEKAIAFEWQINKKHFLDEQNMKNVWKSNAFLHVVTVLNIFWLPYKLLFTLVM